MDSSTISRVAVAWPAKANARRLTVKPYQISMEVRVEGGRRERRKIPSLARVTVRASSGYWQRRAACR